jgi:ABC-2 type transport system ATP-binding protein
LQVLAGHLLPTSGGAEVFGRTPFEDATTMRRTCLVREGQRYPDGYRVHHVLRAAALCFPRWDAANAARLVAEFELPTGRSMTKLSRGMLSAVGVVVGLASRAPLTLFDEPYLGLDAVARQRFYDHLLADVAAEPRTVLLSTHLIDEIADLLEYVVVIDRGRVVVQGEADALRREAVVLTGPAPEVEAAVDAAIGGRDSRSVVDGSVIDRTVDAAVLARERLGGTTRAIVRLGAGPAPMPSATVRVEPLSLQRLVVHLTARPVTPPGNGTPDRPASHGPSGGHDRPRARGAAR